MITKGEIFPEMGEHFKSFSKWILISAIVGIVVGLIGTAFHHAIDMASHFRTENPKVLFLLPFAGVAIAYLYHVCKMDKEKGTNAVLTAVRSPQVLLKRTAPLIFISTVLTHLCGGSSGREGAALQLGGSLSGIVGRRFKLTESDTQIITACGMASGFSALFGTPISAVIFSMEVAQVGKMNYGAMVPAVMSSVISFLVATKLGVVPTALPIRGIPVLSVASIVQVLALGVLCAIISILFCLAMRESSRLYKIYIANKMLRGFIGGVIIVVLTLLVGSYDYNGSGMEVIQNAMLGTAKPEAFVLKTLFTCITLNAGFKGGEIVPSFFTGATFGNVAGGLLGLNPSFGAGIGLIAVFCGVTNCPLASLAMSIELFGVEGLVFFAIACATSYMLSGYSGLYSAQQIIYSKAKGEKINRDVTH